MIPDENIQEQESLMSALESGCKLLKKDFLAATKCSSFIMTKVEDEEESEEQFMAIMETFK